MLMGNGGNIGISAGDDGILMIDDQFANMAERIQAAIKGIHTGELRWVLNTHFHGDHAGGNPVFGQLAPIVAHENVRKRLITDRTDINDIKVRNSLPVLTYPDSISIHFNGEEIRVKHYPNGHTDTDSIITFTKSNVVHMGDHYFNGAFPFIDTANGGDVRNYIANVKKALGEMDADVKVIPGHGPLSNKAELHAWVVDLEASVDLIENKAKEGKARDVILDEPLPSKYDSWGAGFISTKRWISIVLGPEQRN